MANEFTGIWILWMIYHWPPYNRPIDTQQCRKGWLLVDTWTLKQPLASTADAWLARASWLPLWRHITCAHASAAGFPAALGRACAGHAAPLAVGSSHAGHATPLALGHSLMQWPCVRARAPAVVVCVVVGEALSYCFPFWVTNQGRVFHTKQRIIHAKFVLTFVFNTLFFKYPFGVFKSPKDFSL